MLLSAALPALAGAPTWSWEPETPKHIDILNWRWPVPVAPEQEAYVHPNLPPEWDDGEYPPDCRCYSDRTRRQPWDLVSAVLEYFMAEAAQNYVKALGRVGVTAGSTAEAMTGTELAEMQQLLARRALNSTSTLVGSTLAPLSQLLSLTMPTHAKVPPPTTRGAPQRPTASALAGPARPSLQLAARAAAARAPSTSAVPLRQGLPRALISLLSGTAAFDAPGGAGGRTSSSERSGAGGGNGTAAAAGAGLPALAQGLLALMGLDAAEASAVSTNASLGNQSVGAFGELQAPAPGGASAGAGPGVGAAGGGGGGGALARLEAARRRLAAEASLLQSNQAPTSGVGSMHSVRAELAVVGALPARRRAL